MATMGRRVKGLGGFGGWGMGVFFQSVKIVKCFQMFPAWRYFADVYMNLLESSPVFQSKTPCRMLITSIMHTLKSLFWAMVLLVLCCSWSSGLD